VKRLERLVAGGYTMDLKANDFVEDEEAALAAGTDPEQLKVMPAMSPFDVDALILKVPSCAARLPNTPGASHVMFVTLSRRVAVGMGYRGGRPGCTIRHPAEDAFLVCRSGRVR
jgi:hypothetical protein